ncbi:MULTISPECIES: hypothetical protein [Streptosporangium]|uniref:Uncharacterized protein n=1 Tax=Streptosporangium brasiliense TaxID=47480 RepID=A0ABT9RM45_9ACTN|nr:hypothetical protein [Streptosporangium brasiliense]MDP9870330.1 hypothetical protein [Streptosporangium brasiliense]
MEIVIGADYRLTEDFGVGPGSLPAGAIVKATGIYPPGTPGIGWAEEDTVLANYFNSGGAVQTIALVVSAFEQLFVEA